MHFSPTDELFGFCRLFAVHSVTILQNICMTEVQMWRNIFFPQKQSSSHATLWIPHRKTFPSDFQQTINLFYFCPIEINDCFYHNCSGHGKCVDLDRNYHCDCDVDYIGEDCESECRIAFQWSILGSSVYWHLVSWWGVWLIGESIRNLSVMASIPTLSV